MIKESRPSTGLIILAAGSSSRLGQAKQLLEFKGINLLQNAINVGKESCVDHVVVVLGANMDEIKANIDFRSTIVTVNDNWKKGMASSMQIGLKKLMETEYPDQIIIMLCDQPFVDSKLIDSIISVQSESDKGIVACQYNDTLGVPALFTKKYYDQLLNLSTSEGAKKLIYKYLEDCEIISFELGSIDIDTEEDYKNLIGKKT
ncbi:nucleotidyltransferase family protein [Belliella sp. R4-6]|uniref:Nucleotidyltransferase family protein n=1 Tax=Belliella alkalica TaxID=1730871 RepID=A0ABS9V636_9BACT|nr:nucleotidyltransferase family protein [Belliella alkalica]MCH7411892.1 nucleotidyltransferase family protein [Belliella alkalica]